MASLMSNPLPSSNSDRIRRKRKKKPSPVKQDHQIHTRWKSDDQQRIYSSNLIQALSQVTLNAPSPSAPRGGRAVREAADRALAAAAKGRTRWSRAILTNRLKLKFRKHRRHRPPPAVAAAGRSKKPRLSVLRLKGKGMPAVHRKVRFLGRLVPGCRKEPLPVILEEATDYIAALQMQVRAMTALANLLSGASSSSGVTAGSRPPTPTSETELALDA